ncbi:MAG: PAS domain-containing protein, partial [Gammaproteobacteria bacterium]|nr:PAS domain-containing protein [Gammaproteobacteria bacterium]
MLEQVLQIQSYTFDSDAMSMFGTAALILFMSAITLTHERASRVATPLFLLALSTSVWLSSFGIMYCANSATVATWWAKVAHAGIVFIPTSALFFAARVVRGESYRNLGRALSFSVLVSAMYLVLLFTSSDFVLGVEQRWWGPYPRYGAIGSTFVVFLALLVGTCVLLFWSCYRRSPVITAMHRRSKLFFFASVVGSVSIVDFLPMYGFDIYPIGRVTMLCLFAITTYVTWRYRLVDLTPSFVGQQITETMTDALIVMDRDGVVQLINSETNRLLGAQESELMGQSITELFDGLLSVHLQRLAGGEAVRDVE